MKIIATFGARGWMGKSAIEAASQDPTEHFLIYSFFPNQRKSSK